MFCKIHFHGYIDLTGTRCRKQYVNCGSLKLIFESKVIGINNIEEIILKNQDLGDLDLLINLIKKYEIKFIGCKFNKKQLLYISKSDISIELYNKHFRRIDLTNINLNEIDFKSKDIREDLKNKLLLENKVLNPKQANHNNTANSMANSNRMLHLRFNIPNNTPITNNNTFNNNLFQQSSTLSNNNSNLRQMSDMLDKIDMEITEFKEKPSDIPFNK